MIPSPLSTVFFKYLVFWSLFIGKNTIYSRWVDILFDTQHLYNIHSPFFGQFCHNFPIGNYCSPLSFHKHQGELIPPLTVGEVMGHRTDQPEHYSPPAMTTGLNRHIVQLEPERGSETSVALWGKRHTLFSTMLDYVAKMEKNSQEIVRNSTVTIFEPLTPLFFIIM